MSLDLPVPAQAAPPSSVVPTLPGSAYTSPEVFAREQQLIFGKEWVFVGREQELAAPGDVLRAQVGTESVIVVRGRDRRLRAFLNVCRHRGAQLCLTDRASVGNALRCPYHAWTYGLDGRLVTAPNWQAMSDLDRGDYGLGPVRLEVWNGLVWVNLDPQAPPLADQLGPVLAYRLGDGVDRIDHYGIADLVPAARKEYDVAANWKIIQENFQECYHCGTIHPELVEQIPTFASFEELADGGYHQDGYHFAPGRDGFSLSGQARFDPLPGVAEADRRTYFGMVLRPNCFVSLLPDHVIVHRFTAVAPDRTTVVCEWLFPPEVVAADGFDCSDTVELFHRVNEQDFAAAQWCQPGMSSRAYRDGGVLVPTEKAIITWYYEWYHQRMSGSPGVTTVRLLDVCAVADLPDGEVAVVEDPRAGRIAVFAVDGAHYALRDECSHQQAWLSEGFLEGCAVECPLHASLFDLRTGVPSGPPARQPVPTYEVAVRDGRVVVHLPA